MEGRGGRTPATVMAQVMPIILRVVHNVEVTHLVFAVWTAGGDEGNPVWSSLPEESKCKCIHVCYHV